MVLSNAIVFRVLQDNWVQIPYGDFPHPGPVDPRTGRLQFPNGVIQRVDAQSGAEMVTEFENAAAKEGANFGGLPWYIGHHDADPVTYPDGSSYGWIEKLANRADGLYLQVKWTPDGEKLKSNGAFKYYSPFWDAEFTNQKENDKPVMRPWNLKSVGFTNTPNIPVRPLANERPLMRGFGFTISDIEHWTEEQREEIWVSLGNLRKGGKTKSSSTAPVGTAAKVVAAKLNAERNAAAQVAAQKVKKAAARTSASAQSAATAQTAQARASSAAAKISAARLRQ